MLEQKRLRLEKRAFQSMTNTALCQTPRAGGGQLLRRPRRGATRPRACPRVSGHLGTWLAPVFCENGSSNVYRNAHFSERVREKFAIGASGLEGAIW